MSSDVVISHVMCFYDHAQEENGDEEPLEGLSQPEHTFEEVHRHLLVASYRGRLHLVASYRGRLHLVASYRGRLHW